MNTRWRRIRLDHRLRIYGRCDACWWMQIRKTEKHRTRTEPLADVCHAFLSATVAPMRKISLCVWRKLSANTVILFGWTATRLKRDGRGKSKSNKVFSRAM